MNGRFCLCIIGLLFLGIACKDQHAEEEGISLVLAEDNERDSWNFSELFDSVQVIPLQTDEQCLIEEIDKIQYIHERFYILDEHSQAVFIFDKSGNFLRKINAEGKGPGEYIRVTGFDIDPKNLDIYLYDAGCRGVICYDSTGRFVRQIPLELTARVIAIQDSFWVLHPAGGANFLEGKLQAPQLLIRNMKDDSVHSYCPLTIKDNDYVCRIYEYGEAFQHNGDELLYWSAFDPHIYTIRQGQMKVKYKLDFGKYNLPAGLVPDYIRNSDYAYGLNSYWENDHYCFFQMTLKKQSLQFLYDKKRNKLYHGYLSKDLNPHLYPHIITATNEYMLTYKKVNELFLMNGYMKEKGIENEELSELLNGVNEDDNPMVLLYRFKK